MSNKDDLAPWLKEMESGIEERGWDDVAVASTIAYWLDLSTCSQWYASIVEGDALEICMCWVREADQRFCLTADVTFEEARSRVGLMGIPLTWSDVNLQDLSAYFSEFRALVNL